MVENEIGIVFHSSFWGPKEQFWGVQLKAFTVWLFSYKNGPPQSAATSAGELFFTSWSLNQTVQSRWMYGWNQAEHGLTFCGGQFGSIILAIFCCFIWIFAGFCFVSRFRAIRASYLRVSRDNKTPGRVLFSNFCGVHEAILLLLEVLRKTTTGSSGGISFVTFLKWDIRRWNIRKAFI